MIGANDTAMNELSAGVFYGPGAMIGYYDAFSRNSVNLGKSYGFDGMGVHYYTPNLSGFQAAVTYIPSDSSDGSGDGYYSLNDSDTDAAGDNIWSVGVNYTNDFDGIRVSASGGYSDADGNDQEAWSLGLEVGASGFTGAVHYEDNAGDAGQDLAVGVNYKTGPWSATVGYATLLDAPAGGDVDRFAGWVTYSMAPGVSGTVGVEYADTDAGSDTAGVAYLTLGF